MNKYWFILIVSGIVGCAGIPALFFNPEASILLFTAGSVGGMWVVWSLRDV